MRVIVLKFINTIDETSSLKNRHVFQSNLRQIYLQNNILKAESFKHLLPNA